MSTAELTALEFTESDDPELNQLCVEHQQIKAEIALLRSRINELDKEAQRRADQIQAAMGPHKAIRTWGGFTARWVHKTVKGYTVAPKEFDQWECRSPF